jgi:hypothetical protein
MLPNDSWGFAVEKQAGMTSNFDTIYTVNDANNKYALLPTSDQTIYETDKALGETPTPLSDFKSFYGAKLTLGTVAGEYKTTITYTAIGETVPCQWNSSISFDDAECVEPAPPPDEVFKFTIDMRLTDTVNTDPGHMSSADTLFEIPTVASIGNVFHWDVDWGDGSSENVGSYGGECMWGGTSHSYATPGQYQISIRPSYNTNYNSWMNCFRNSHVECYSAGSSSFSGSKANLAKIKSIDTILTENMFTTFSQRFGCMRNLELIPDNLFSEIDFSSMTACDYLFSETFRQTSYNITTMTIPTNLFSTLDTSNCQTTRAMFQNTFYNFAYSSSVATIPNGFLNGVDTTNSTNINSVLEGTFSGFAYANKKGGTPDTDLGTVFTNATLVGFTASNVGATTIGRTFSRTFQSMSSLVGQGQAFIDSKLGGISPSSTTYTFSQTGLSDLSSLASGWWSY